MLKEHIHLNDIHDIGETKLTAPYVYREKVNTAIAVVHVVVAMYVVAVIVVPVENVESPGHHYGGIWSLRY